VQGACGDERAGHSGVSFPIFEVFRSLVGDK